MKNAKYTFGLLFLQFFAGFPFSSCTKFVSVSPPPTELVGSAVFTSDGSAITAVVGIYSGMMQTGGFTSNISMWTGLSADELVNYSTNAIQGEFFENALTPTNNNVKNIWSLNYQTIYQANSVLDGLATSTGVSEAVKQQLNGEAKFIRAYSYFYLVNLFGPVPLVTTTDYLKNKSLARSSASVIYQQILSDLKDAQTLLATDYHFSNGERIRPCSWAADALLSKVYLYAGDWHNAELEASSVIDNNIFSLNGDPDSVFLANSSEAIWQLQPVVPSYNTWDATNFILLGEPTIVALNSPLFDAFEPGDRRRISWVDSIQVSGQTYHFPYKYKVITGETLTEYLMMPRLGEIYLIRAEARARQNNITGALADLNEIRNRANLPASLAIDQQSLLDAITHERQVELFTEAANRWLDLKRTGQAGIVLSPLKSGWQSADTLYPIPQSEIQNDANLIQNSGY
jgi:hypothetical protein